MSYGGHRQTDRHTDRRHAKNNFFGFSGPQNVNIHQNLEVDFFGKCNTFSILRIAEKVKRFQGLKATNEQQDNGTGILHQVAQHPIDQVYLYKRRPSPSPLTQDPERRYWLQGRQVYVTSKPPTPCSDGQLKCVANESFTDDLSRASNLGQADARPELYHYTITYVGLQVLLEVPFHSMHQTQ